MDECIYPIDLEYNREILKECIERIDIWPEYSPDKGNTILDHKDILFPINIEAYKIKNSLLESTTYSFSWVPPFSETGFHTDATRGCTLIVPIDDTPHLIKFEGKEDYYYNFPVLTNAKTLHNGINYTDKNRYNLLFHFDKSYNEVVNLAKNNKLVTNWIQIYPLTLNFENKIIQKYFNCNNSGVNIIDKVCDGLISINYSRTIKYEKSNDYDICLAIKYMIENPIVKSIELV
jgi:hypothetical protein